MDTSVLILLGGVAIVAIYFATHTEVEHLPPPGPPVTANKSSGNLAKAECAAGALAGSVGAASLGIPPAVGAAAGCALAPLVVKGLTYVWDGTKWVAKEVGEFVGNVAKDTAKVANAVAGGVSDAAKALNPVSALNQSQTPDDQLIAMACSGNGSAQYQAQFRGIDWKSKCKEQATVVPPSAGPLQEAASGAAHFTAIPPYVVPSTGQQIESKRGRSHF